MTNIFIAASFPDRLIAKGIAEQCQKAGYEVTTRWWEHIDDQKSKEWCEDDISNINKANILVLYNSEKRTAGKYIEVGMAIQRHIPIFVFGMPVPTVYRHRTHYLGKTITDEIIGSFNRLIGKEISPREYLLRGGDILNTLGLIRGALLFQGNLRFVDWIDLVRDNYLIEYDMPESLILKAKQIWDESPEILKNLNIFVSITKDMLVIRDPRNVAWDTDGQSKE